MQRSSAVIFSVAITMVIIAGPCLYAQNSGDASLKEAKIDTLFIADYTHLLTTRAFAVFQDASIMSNPGNIDKIVYKPNVDFRLGISGNYRWFGAGFSVENFIQWRDAGLYGKTTSLDLRVNAFGRSVAGELFFQKYRGFYISYPQRNDHSYYLMPDMSSLSFGAAGYWIYNAKKFSLRAAFIQNERQKKSAGSFLIRPSVLYYKLSSDHGIIPEELAKRYNIPTDNLFTGGTTVALGLAPGYSYTLIFLKYLYISGTLLPGVAAQFYTFEADAGDYHDFEFVLKVGVRMALGYNSDKWFIGGALQTSLQSVPDKLSQALFDYDIFQLRIWGDCGLICSGKKTYLCKVMQDKMVFITRREHFSAAHRLFLPEYSEEQNLEVFGKCSNPNWHGHNYILFVTVKGYPDPKTGLIVHLRHVSRLIDEKILKKVDHKNLNMEVDFLAGKVPTSENIAIGIWNELDADIRALGAWLHCIRLEQSENNIIEYYGQ